MQGKGLVEPAHVRKTSRHSVSCGYCVPIRQAEGRLRHILGTSVQSESLIVVGEFHETSREIAHGISGIAQASPPSTLKSLKSVFEQG